MNAEQELELISQGWGQLVVMLQCLPQAFVSTALADPAGSEFFQTLFKITQQNNEKQLHLAEDWSAELAVISRELQMFLDAPASNGFREELNLFRAGLQMLGSHLDKLQSNPPRQTADSLRVSSLDTSTSRQLRIIPSTHAAVPAEQIVLAQTENNPSNTGRKRIQLRRTQNPEAAPSATYPPKELSPCPAAQPSSQKDDFPKPESQRTGDAAEPRQPRKIVLRHTRPEPAPAPERAQIESEEMELQRLRAENKALKDTVAGLRARLAAHGLAAEM